MPASKQHFKHYNESIHNPSKIGENTYVFSISYFYSCFSIWEPKWIKYNKLNSATSFTLLRRLSLQPKLAIAIEKSLFSPQHKDLWMPKMLCVREVYFWRKNILFLWIQVIQASPRYSYKTQLISALSMEIFSSYCQPSLGRIYDNCDHFKRLALYVVLCFSLFYWHSFQICREAFKVINGMADFLKQINYLISDWNSRITLNPLFLGKQS